MNVAEEITPAIGEFRAMAHEHLDQALDKLRPLFEQDKKPTLQEISDAMQDVKQDLAGSLVQEAGPRPCIRTMASRICVSALSAGPWSKSCGMPPVRLRPDTDQA